VAGVGERADEVLLVLLGTSADEGLLRSADDDVQKWAFPQEVSPPPIRNSATLTAALWRAGREGV